jgi:hypothetical protein
LQILKEDGVGRRNGSLHFLMRICNHSIT